MAEKKSDAKKNLKTAAVYAAISIGVILVVLILNQFEFFDSLEFATQDMRFRIRGVEPHTEDVVIVGIDPQTLDMLMIIGMPTRDYHATLIENLYKAGAKAVLFDVLFLSYTGEVDQSMSLDDAISRNDSLLAGALAARPNTVIARKSKVTMKDATQQTAGEATTPPGLFQIPDQLANVDMFQDGDSFIRRTKLIFDDMPPEHGWNYSFALKAAMYAVGADTAWIDTEKHIAHVGDIEIPLNEDNFMIINYAMDETTYQKSDGYISYEQVVDDSEWGLGVLIEKERFKDKVVMIGAAWPESHDEFPTPFYKGTTLFSKNEFAMYGVHVHKSIATTILEQRFIIPTRRWQFVMLVVMMSIIASLINFRFRGFLGIVLSVFLVGLYTVISFALFLQLRRLIPVIAPAFITVTLNYISTVTYNFLAERKQKAMIKGAFAQYVPPAVVGELIKNPDLLTLGGEERVMSVIFSDVAGFTSISENLSPTELVELLNEYLTAMTNIVLDYDGIIDKYEGDAIMAEFGAPLPDEDHALKACYTAIDMQARLAILREKLLAE
ncbi:MAG: adenylate/guanylate cyclase domain-containing protein, partial [Candidatus Latescibacteria bacterium]|nr:adenylate/guanylate cyclase domain-containing protein [Candidatus Latescibacterota bacterium]